MARQRLGVVLLVPQPIATQVDGLRAALGDGALARIAPHVTLVPPINVAERDLPKVFAHVRAAAAAAGPLDLRLGPVLTFAPANPVAYLAVGGDEETLARLHALRAALRAGPLDRPDQHEFVPHVTVADELPPARLDAAVTALRAFSAPIAVDRVHVLAQGAGRQWSPIADVALGGSSSTVGRGSLPLEMTVGGGPDLEAAALLSIEQDAPGRPFGISARREGALVAAAWGWSAHERLEVADLVVAAAHRGEGVGRHLLAAVEALGVRRGCRWAGAAAPADGAAGALLRAAGWMPAPDGEDDPPARHRRWARRLPDPEPDA